MFKNDSFAKWLENINQMVGYHQTGSQENAQSILQGGFSLEKARKYELGLGVYLTPSLWGMRYNVNQPIIKCLINNSNNFLDISKRTNQLNNFTPEEQEILIGLNNYVPPNTSNSPILQKVRNTFRGLMTNRIIVVYNSADVVPQSIVNENEMPS